MAAVDVLTSSTVVVASSDQWRSGIMQNRGPNSIWYSTEGTAVATTTGVELASGASVGFVLGPGESLRAIASTADQSSPANTRVETSGFPG